MSIEMMRQAILTVYPNKKWADRVKAMSDSQIIAIYKNFKLKGVI